MFVTAAWAKTRKCFQHSKRTNCISQQCMAWRPITLYATTFTTGFGKTIIQWSMTPQEQGVPVDCGYCGVAGPPIGDRSMAPEGCDEKALLDAIKNADNVGYRARRITPTERLILKELGLNAPKQVPGVPVKRRRTFYFAENSAPKKDDGPQDKPEQKPLKGKRPIRWKWNVEEK